MSVHEAGTTISFCPPMLHHYLWHNVIIPPVLLTLWFLEPPKFEGFLHGLVFLPQKTRYFQEFTKTLIVRHLYLCDISTTYLAHCKSYALMV